MTDPHTCQFPEVEIGDDLLDAAGILQKGMRVLIPCACGETPVDHMELLEAEHKQASDALLQADPWRPLYHWSPTARRRQITRYGLRPNMRRTTHAGDGEGWRASCICFADSPSWAWALSAGQRSAPAGSWDLWQTYLEKLTDPIVLASTDRPSGIHEVRVTERVYKRDLWLVGTREKL